MDYHGKVMRMELTNGAEAVGTFVSADAPSQQITFTNVRYVKIAGGAPNPNPWEVKPSEVMHRVQGSDEETWSGAPRRHNTASQLTTYQPPLVKSVDNHAPRPRPAQAPQTMEPIQPPAAMPSIQTNNVQPAQPPAAQQKPVNPPEAAPRQPAWGRGAPGRGALAGRGAQPPARAPQAAPTAGGAPPSAAGRAPAAAAGPPSNWARALGGGGGGGRGGGGGGGGGRGGGRGGRGRGRAWTPGVPQGDASAAAVADDFDFAANNNSFEANKANLRAEEGVDPLPPSERKVEFEDDFFDMISHTLHEKQGLVQPAPRPGIKEQREINMETFGAATVPRSAHPRGVGGRGYNGAAGAQGGGTTYNGGAGAYGRRGGGGGGRGGGAARGGGADAGGRWGRGGGRGEGGRGRGGGGGGAWGRGGGGRGAAANTGRNGGAGRGAVRGRAAAVA